MIEPACFGVSICFDPKSKVCKSCDFRSRCVDLGRVEAIRVAEEFESSDLLSRFNESTNTVGQTVKKNKFRIRERYEVRQGKRDTQPGEVLSHQLKGSIQLSPRGKNLVYNLCERGIDLTLVRQGIVQKELQKLPWLYNSVNLLKKEGFTRKQLVNQFKEQHSWIDSTARSYASLTINVLSSLDLIDPQELHMRLK